MLAILTTHPIQYQIPLWQALAQEGSLPFEVWYLSDHGTKRSYDTQFGQAFAWDIDTLSGYPYHFLPAHDKTQVNHFFKMRLPQSFGKLCKAKGVKVLWVQGWQVLAYWQAIWQAHAQGISIWLRGESNDIVRPNGTKKIIHRFLLKQLFNRVSYFFYIGSANRRLYQSYGIPEHKLITAPYFVDNQRFTFMAQNLVNDRSFIRQQFGIPEKAFCLLFCGKFIPKKRPEDLLDATVKIISQNPTLVQQEQIHLLMVGSGELGTLLEAKAAQIKQQYGRSVISFAGFLNQTEIAKAYVAADCLVLPSNAGETWGLVANEALACGRPVIVSDQCGCAEDLAQPLGQSFIYPCGDVVALVNRLQDLIYKNTKLPSWEKIEPLLQKHSVQTTLSSVLTTYAFKDKGALQTAST